MNPPFSLDDLAAKKTNQVGGITYIFDRAKSAKSILARMILAVETFDAKEDRPEIWYYSEGCWHPGGAQLISYFLDEVAQNLSDVENINDVLRRVRGKLRLQPLEFDAANPCLVGCKDGITLDLRTGKARKAAPTDLISMPIPLKYDPEARCPEFIRFLEDVTATDDDRISIIDFLASLLIVQPMDFFVAAPGLGSNGRSKLKDFIRAFVGSDACRSIPLKDLKQRFMTGFLTRTRVNFANETEVTAIALEFIKRCSERMPAEQKFKGMANALLYTKWFFDTNTMPAIADNSYGAERRICRWDMPWRFVDQPDGPMEKLKDPNIIARITTPEELSGVLNLVLERAPEVIKQRMIHHRDGGLQEYALQSRSGDVFLELFLTATANEGDRVHLDTLRTAYNRYATVTNSSALGSKAMKTIIQDKLDRLWEKDVKIDNVNRSGYKGLRFDKELFEGTMTTLEKARTECKPVFTVLLNAFPDLLNSTNSTVFYHNSTIENSISILYGRIVEKYADREYEGNEKGNSRNFPREKLASKNSTFSTFQEKRPPDAENAGRIIVESEDPGRAIVEEFLRDGGQAAKQRFLAEFPEASDPEVG